VRSSSAGLLLFLIAALGLIGFLSGNLDRWLGYLFSPGRPALSGGAATGTATTALPSVGSQTQRATA